jgi:hypothetical protein
MSSNGMCPIFRRGRSKLHAEAVFSSETSIDFCKVTFVHIVEANVSQKIVKTFRTNETLAEDV